MNSDTLLLISVLCSASVPQREQTTSYIPGVMGRGWTQKEEDGGWVPESPVFFLPIGYPLIKLMKQAQTPWEILLESF